MTTGPAAPSPPPPPGPGVQAPFVTPPTDGARQRRWWAVGLSIGVAVLCCVGGLLGTGGLVVLGGRMVVDSTRATVDRYLTALEQADYEKAYAELCDAEQRRISAEAFAAAAGREPRIVSFQVEQPAIGNGDQPIQVPADVRYADGSAARVVYEVVQDESTAEFEVCGRAG